MPYSAAHKVEVRSRIVEHARMLFNRNGFSEVSIDQIMAGVGLTRGGFYNHFRSKDELYAEAVTSFLEGRGKTWRDDAGIDPENGGPATVQAMIDSYLSSEHLGDIEGQCPMIALPSDIARATAEARDAYQTLLRAMAWLFEHNLPQDARRNARPRWRCRPCALAAWSYQGRLTMHRLPTRFERRRMIVPSVLPAWIERQISYGSLAAATTLPALS